MEGGQQQRERLGIPVDDGKKILLVSESQDCIKKATEVVPAEIFDEMNRPPVDPFLAEALQDPRHRLTILRLEKEIQKFISNSKLKQLEFLPMPSSYVRLAAHRVAQHYHMKTTVIENRVVCFKTGESSQQVPRLGELYAESVEAIQPKVAIKRRPKPEGDKKSLKLDSAKSVEERSEDYIKARARIFSEEIGEGGDVRVCCHIEVVRVDSSSSGGGENEVVTGEVNETIQDPPAVKTCSKSDKENMSRSREINNNNNNNNNNNISSSNINNINNCSKAKNSTTTNNRVAIFRDREKDSRDPDYDRSYDRYLQRRDVTMAPIFNMQFEQPAWIAQPRYDPQAAVFLMQAQQSMIYPGPYAPQNPRFFQPPRFQSYHQPGSYIQSRH